MPPRRRRTIGVIAVICLAAVATATRPAAAQSALEIAYQQALEAAKSIAIPDAIAPLVTIAENADAIAVAALEISAGLRDRQIKGEYPSASRARQKELDRQEKANEAIKGALARLKAKRCAAEKKAKDDGWDPFHGRFTCGGPFMAPGTYAFHLLNDGFGDIPGDDPPGPIASIVTAGYVRDPDRDPRAAARLVRDPARRLHGP
jgi:hypothetical protein